MIVDPVHPSELSVVAYCQGRREALMALLELELGERPDLTLDHNPFPVGTRPFAGWKDEILDQWRQTR